MTRIVATTAAAATPHARQLRITGADGSNNARPTGYFFWASSCASMPRFRNPPPCPAGRFRHREFLFTLLHDGVTPMRNLRAFPPHRQDFNRYRLDQRVETLTGNDPKPRDGVAGDLGEEQHASHGNLDNHVIERGVGLN